MILADVVNAMREAGCSAEQIGAAIAILAVKPRSNNAERQARYRAAHPVTVTRNGNALLSPLPSPEKEKSPHTPLKEKLTLPLPPPESSLRSDSSTEAVDLFGEPEQPIKMAKPDRSQATETLRVAGEGWNAVAASLRLPLIEAIKPGSMRERNTLARGRDLKTDYGMEPEEGFALLFQAKIRGSPFMRGEINGFVCTFDWVMKASNFTKIMEDNYAVRQKVKGHFAGNGVHRPGH